jgi:hypothetical protein
MMKSPFTQTLLMGLLAAGTSLLAAWFYPWPEMVSRSDLVGKPLFDSFEASEVRSILITEFDPETNDLKQIEVRRSGQTWVLPGFQNYPADNRDQISLAINSVNVSVLEQRSNDQQDHVEFGVIDPAEYESSVPRNSLGSKIVLRDRNNVELANMIVGASPADQSNIRQSRRFVRIAGDPGVYVVEVPRNAISANFPSWVDTNLLKLGGEATGEMLIVNKFSQAAESLKNPGNRNWDYRLAINLLTQTPEFSAPNSLGQLQAIPFSAENEAALNPLANNLPGIRFSEVRRKPRALATLLQTPELELAGETIAQLESLTEAGFAAVAIQPHRKFPLGLNSLGGELVFRYADGIEISLLVGKPVEGPVVLGSREHRLVMLYASLDETAFPAVEPLDEQADDQARRAYLRGVEERETRIKNGINRAQLLNENYAEWYYVVPEILINAIFPPLRVPPPAEIKTPPTVPDSPAAESQPETKTDPTEKEQTENSIESREDTAAAERGLPPATETV